MASSADVRDIMGLGAHNSTPDLITKEMILGTDKPKRMYSKKSEMAKRPEGMARELYNLLYNDSKDAPPLIPTDTTMTKDKGYKQLKAKLGMKKVRSWKWMPFTNVARKDHLVLYHWRRAADEGKEYTFARFNKQLEIACFSDVEYHNHLVVDGWSRAETDHLIDLCSRFDLRFTVIHDRWNRDMFKKPRTIEDLKERYYGIVEKLDALRPDPIKAGSKPFHYDSDHERRRKEQLRRLYDRTADEVEEEETLRNELKRIEARKREREKKTQDLQKLIAQADSTTTAATSAAAAAAASASASTVKSTANSTTTGDKKSSKRKSTAGINAGSSSKNTAAAKDSIGSLEAPSSGIKFPDLKGQGTTLRSSRLKMPSSLGQKKVKAIEQMLMEIGIDVLSVPNEEICVEFNELRSEMALLYDLKNVLSTCEMELHSLKAEYEAMCPGKSLEIPEKLIKPAVPAGSAASSPSAATSTPGAQPKPRNLSDVIDVVGSGSSPLVRKRKAALEQSNVLKKIKNKNF